MLFPVLGAHISGTEFQYPDYSWKEPTGMMTNLVAHSGDNKGQFKDITEAICRDFREHDKAEAIPRPPPAAPRLQGLFRLLSEV